mgnify:CR=1 FL=1
MRTMSEVLTKRLGGVRQGIDEETRTATFVFSSNSADRSGDIIDQSTWQLDRYKQNPVFLWAHKSRELPIGQTVDLMVKGNRLIGKVKFATAEESEFSDTCWKLVKGGYLNAVSVGFIPHKWESYSDDTTGAHGYKLFDCELLECSLVPIPCNQDALVGSKDFGALPKVFSDLIAAYEDTDGDVFSKSELEAVVKAFGEQKSAPDAKNVDDMDGADVYDKSGEFMGLMVGGALKVARSYQDKLRNRNAALIDMQAPAKTEATTEKKAAPTVGPNFFLKSAPRRALYRRTLLGL